MTLRHICPRSVEWYEATLTGGEEALTAAEVLHLRTLRRMERATEGLPDQDRRGRARPGVERQQQRQRAA